MMENDVLLSGIILLVIAFVLSIKWYTYNDSILTNFVYTLYTLTSLLWIVVVLTNM